MSVLHDNDDPELNLDDLEDDIHHSPDSMLKNPTFATPLIPSSSVISSPSGLTIDTISRLMHDELRHNVEFMKQLWMVDALQELLGLRERTSAGKLFFCFFVVCTNFFFLVDFFQYPRQSSVQQSSVQTVRPCAQASRLRKFLLVP